MSTAVRENLEPPADLPESASEDATGRERMAWNVLASWSGHAVFVLAGFIMPRFIDRRIGQEALGIWDFAWSVVGYFGLAELGIGSSVGRYIAKYRTAGDVEGLRRVVSSVLAVQTAAGVLVLLLTVGVAWSLPLLFGERLGVHTGVAGPVVLLLGTGLAVQTACDVFHGVMTGCHRWDYHNAINAGSYALTVVAMIVAVSMGGGLRSMAVANFCGVLLAETLRRAVAYRVCPEMRFRLSYVQWGQIRRMVLFGMKSSINGLARLVLVQGNSLVIAAHLGPATLALFARPSSLIRHVENIVNKFAHVLIPTASSLQTRGEHRELRELLMEGARLGTSLALPMVMFLVILGDPLLHLWMGPRYQQGLVLSVLALGFLLPVAQQPVLTILIGLNSHGRVGLANLAISGLGVAFGMLAVGRLGWGLLGGALGIAVPLLIGSGLLIPLYACRQLRTRPVEYVRRAFLGPLLCATPFGLCLLGARLLFGTRPALALVAGVAAGVLVLVPLYWRYVVPATLRVQVGRLVTRMLRRAPPPQP
jgi:O-antigen/teichoic acid export membrane protein